MGHSNVPTLVGHFLAILELMYERENRLWKLWNGGLGIGVGDLGLELGNWGLGVGD